MDLKLEHCQRVSRACESAVSHASLMLDQSMQEFVKMILDLGPSRIEHCLREISKRGGGSKRKQQS
jgi:hypothetical protein